MKTYLIINYSKVHEQYHVVKISQKEVEEYCQDLLTFPLSQKDLAVKVRDNLNKASRININASPVRKHRAA